MSIALVRRHAARYPAPPFDPPEIYPELRSLGLTETDPDNLVYPMVRRALELTGLDRQHAGTTDWNPLGDLVRPGERAVLKPNFVQHLEHAGGLEHLVTHPSVVRPVLDYLWRALGDLRQVRVVDAPEIDCRLDLALARLGWPALASLYEAHGQRLELIDIRGEWADYRHGAAIVDRHALPGDPRGNVCVDLGARSELAPIAGEGKFYGADYDRRWTNRHHTHDVNRYVVSRTFLEADLVVSIPKLKTHKKAGLTCAMKNLVGINGDKNLLPHYTVGDALVGGCEYSGAPRSVLQQFSRAVDRLVRDRLLATGSPLAGKLYNRLEGWRDRRFPLTDAEVWTKGDWWGNDVLWRTIVDLNKILRYASPTGELAREPLRRELALVDGVLAGEGEGPHRASPRQLGTVIAGTSGAEVDRLAAQWIGFDPALVPQLTGALAARELPLVGERRSRVVADLDRAVSEIAVGAPPPSHAAFRPAAGWAGRLGSPGGTE